MRKNSGNADDCQPHKVQQGWCHSFILQALSFVIEVFFFWLPYFIILAGKREHGESFSLQHCLHSRKYIWKIMNRSFFTIKRTIKEIGESTKVLLLWCYKTLLCSSVIALVVWLNLSVVTPELLWCRMCWWLAKEGDLVGYSYLLQSDRLEKKVC